jgi:hypothetical protein
MVLMSASPVRAQNALWVSIAGNDGLGCSQFSPCRTFQGAINKGNVTQINCLNSGNFGPVTISASITIDCGSGNVGNIISASNGITISASSAVNVVLRHLSLNGLDTATNAIATVEPFAGSLILENCTLQGYTGASISFVPNSGRSTLQVSDSQIINNSNGILVSPSFAQIASVILNRVEISRSVNFGLLLEGNGVVAGTMRDSLIASNGGDGVLSTASQTFFAIEGSSIMANLGTGVFAAQGANLNVTASTISANGTGINVLAGSVASFGNNVLNGNGTDGTFTSTTALK